EMERQHADFARTFQSATNGHASLIAAQAERDVTFSSERLEQSSEAVVRGRAFATAPALSIRRQRERRQRTLADQHRVHELDGDVCCVAGFGAVAEDEQPSATLKALRHLQAGARQTVGLEIEKRRGDVAREREALLDERAPGEVGNRHSIPLSAICANSWS